MDDYNHFRPHDALAKTPPIKYAKINSNGNIWAPEIDLNDLCENELLEYNNEFKEVLKPNI